MGNYRSKPITEKIIESQNSTDNFVYVGVSMEGWRLNMEDAMICKKLNEKIFLFAIFDGHGGSEVA